MNDYKKCLFWTNFIKMITYRGYSYNEIDKKYIFDLRYICNNFNHLNFIFYDEYANKIKLHIITKSKPDKKTIKEIANNHIKSDIKHTIFVLLSSHLALKKEFMRLKNIDIEIFNFDFFNSCIIEHYVQPKNLVVLKPHIYMNHPFLKKEYNKLQKISIFDPLSMFFNMKRGDIITGIRYIDDQPNRFYRICLLE